ncbi:hypothetical protein DMJ13_27400 [halophilic archaeon]|nr:hypothetical protein DMJ13_27400 [halophilic archaeon]
MTAAHDALSAAVDGLGPAPAEWPGVSHARLNPTAAVLETDARGGRLSVGYRPNKRDWTITYQHPQDWTRHFADVEDALAQLRESAARLDRGLPPYADGPGTDAATTNGGRR